MNKTQRNTLTRPKPAEIIQFKGVDSELVDYLDFITTIVPRDIPQLQLIIRIQGDSGHLGDALTAKRRLEILKEQGATVIIMLEAVTGLGGLIIGLSASPGLCLMHANTIVSLTGIRIDYERKYTKVSLGTLIEAVEGDLNSLKSDLIEYGLFSNQAIAAGANPQQTASLFRRLLEKGEKINLSPEALVQMGLVDAVFKSEEELNARLQF